MNHQAYHGKPALNRAFILALIIAAAPLLQGCFYSREMVRTGRELQRAFPEVRLHREATMSFGPGTLRLLDGLAGLSGEPEAREASLYLRDIRRLKIGVYEMSMRDPERTFRPDVSKLPRFSGKGWHTAVRARDEEGYVNVMYRERNGDIRDMYVVALSDDEVVLVRLSGRLSRVFERAIEHHAVPKLLRRRSERHETDAQDDASERSDDTADF